MSNQGFQVDNKQKGIALLTVIWVLTILLVIVFSFTYLARTETQAAHSFKEGIENKFLAEAGIERGILELFYRQKYRGAAFLLAGNELWRTDGAPYSIPLGEGTYSVRLFDESGKIDLNTGEVTLLKNLLTGLGVTGVDLETIVDSIQDWKDKDDLIRLNGAESEYYKSLPGPYKAKNADFDSLEELIMVKGITRELLYGAGNQKGLKEFLTVLGKTRTINANAAPKEVLMAVPGMSLEVAEAIIGFRRTNEFKNDQELVPLLGPNANQIKPFLTTASSNTFTLESFGYGKRSQLGAGIRAAVSLQSVNNYKLIYYKTPVTLKKDEPSPK
jgi:general secretion pathway protein K